MTDISATELKNVLKKQQDALKMPMYITELDIDQADDTKQKNQYQSIFPSMWEAEYCAGITLWGYVHGATWVDNSGLYKSGKERPAMTWLKEYMATDKAKNAKSPFPGMKKEASIYIKPADYKVAKGDVVAIKVRARMATKTIEKVDLYVGSSVASATTLVATMTEAPYIAEYTASTSGWKSSRLSSLLPMALPTSVMAASTCSLLQPSARPTTSSRSSCPAPSLLESTTRVLPA